MRSFIAKRLVAASILFGSTVQAVPVTEEADEPVNVYDIFPVEVVIEKPTSVDIFCPTNGVYAVDEEVTFTITDAPATIITEITKYSTVQTQTTILRDDCQQDAAQAFPTSVMPWLETCLPPTGTNITLPPSGDRKIPLTIGIPGQTYGVCGAQPAATAGAKYQTVPVDYKGPCSTITDFGYAGPTPTTYRFSPVAGETEGLAVACKPGSASPPSCDACVTITKIVDGADAPVTISLPPTGTQTEGTIIVITPPPSVPDADGDGTVTLTQPLPSGTEAITTTLQPGSPGDSTTVIVLQPTAVLPGVQPGRTTITRPGTGSGPSTSVLPDSGNEGTTTVIIFEPTVAPGDTVTSTTIIPSGPGFTTTITATDPDDPNTVIIGTTAPGTVTVTSVIPDGSPGFTSTITATGTNPDTVIIGTTDPGTVTVTSVITDDGPGFTTTITATDPEDPDTVIIGTTAVPPVTITTTITDDAPGFTSTITASETDDQDTVIIGVPPTGVEEEEETATITNTQSTTTFTVPIGAGSSYESTITATDGGPDTVIIGSPAPESAPQTLITDAPTESQNLPGLPSPTESASTNVPQETSVTTTETSSVSPTFVFRNDGGTATVSSSASASATATADPTGGEETATEDEESATATDDEESATATDDGETATDDGETATATATATDDGEGEGGEGGEGGTATATGTNPSDTAPPADTSCDNAGFRYAMIPHNYFNGDAPTYSNVDVVGLREARPVYIGRNPNYIGYYLPYPGAPQFNLEYMAINHEAWLNAVIPGDYTIFLPNSDDITFVWVGSDAYSGWTRENADAELGVFAGVSRTVTVTLAAGDHLPIRVLWVNGQGGYFLEVTIRNPNGDIIASADVMNSDYIVQDTCEPFAPDFPPMPPVYDPSELVVPSSSEEVN